MKTLAEFIRTTLIGGVLVLVPIYVLVLADLERHCPRRRSLSPVTAQIPASDEFRNLLALLIVIAACFVAGLVVRTGPGRRGLEVLQGRVLGKVPGYTLLRNLFSRISGDDSMAAFSPAMVEIEDALVPAIIIEELPDGQLCGVGALGADAGGRRLVCLACGRVHRVNVPLRQILSVYGRWGEGTGALVAAMQTGGGQRG